MLEVRTALSYVSVGGAQANLAARGRRELRRRPSGRIDRDRFTTQLNAGPNQALFVDRYEPADDLGAMSNWYVWAVESSAPPSFGAGSTAREG